MVSSMYGAVSVPASSLAMADTASVVLWQAEAPCRRPNGIEMST